jgi:hypothetical protein
MESLVDDIINKSQRVIYGAYSKRKKDHAYYFHLEALVTNREDAVEYLNKLQISGGTCLESDPGHIGAIMQDPLYKEICLRHNIDYKGIMKHDGKNWITLCEKMTRSEIEYFYKRYKRNASEGDEIHKEYEFCCDYPTLCNWYIIVEMPLYNKTPYFRALDDYNFQNACE